MGTTACVGYGNNAVSAFRYGYTGPVAKRNAGCLKLRLLEDAAGCQSFSGCVPERLRSAALLVFWSSIIIEHGLLLEAKVLATGTRIACTAIGISCVAGELVSTPQAASSLTPVLCSQQQDDRVHVPAADHQEEHTGPRTRRMSQAAHAPAYSITGDEDLSTIVPGRYEILGGKSIIPSRETRTGRHRF